MNHIRAGFGHVLNNTYSSTQDLYALIGSLDLRVYWGAVKWDRNGLSCLQSLPLGLESRAWVMYDNIA